jgi:DHA2 family methylenomycin A resistance protein-like MFS transporter
MHVPNTSLTLSTVRAATLPRRRAAKPTLWPIIAATSFGFALVQLDVSIVNVALARISELLGGGVTGLQWIVDSYAIAFASLLLAAGALGDRVGARRTYIAGLTLFAIASVACGIAPGTGTLIAARALQGVGAAFVVPCSLAPLTHACGDDDAARARAISLWTAAGSVTLSAGPLLGGLLVDALGWRSIFLVNIPIGAAGIWWTWRTVAETPRRNGALDLPGQALVLLMLLGLTGAIIEAGHRGTDAPLVVAGFIGALLCGAGFLLREARTADPMVPLGFFRNSTFSAAILVGLVINLTLYGTIFLLGLYLQQILGYSPAIAGLAFLPLPVVLGMANVAAGTIGRRFGLRIPMALGLIIAGIGFWLLARLSATTNYASLLPGLVVIPLGVGLSVPLMTSALLATVPRIRSGVASGVLNTVRQGGGCVGVALFGALMGGGGVAGIRSALMLSAALLACGAVVAVTGIRPTSPRANDDQEGKGGARPDFSEAMQHTPDASRGRVSPDQGPY